MKPPAIKHTLGKVQTLHDVAKNQVFHSLLPKYWERNGSINPMINVHFPHRLNSAPCLIIPTLMLLVMIKDVCGFLQLTDGGKAAKAGIAVSDMVLSIDGIATEGMNHLEAQNKIKSCADNLSLTLQK